MVHIITLKELRPELPKVIKNIDTKLDRYVITKRGKPVAIMMSVDEYASIIETVEILSDEKMMKDIRQGQKEIARGETIPLEEVKRQLEK